MTNLFKAIIVFLLCISLVACGAVNDKQVDNQAITPEASNESADTAKVSEEFDKLAASNVELNELKQFIDTNIKAADMQTADKMLYFLIETMYNGLEKEVDYFYGDNSIEIQNKIVQAYEKDTSKFENGYVFGGSSKFNLVDSMDDQGMADYMQKLFDKGYGLCSGEGTYYPVIDYKALKESYIDSVSEASAEYLDIMANELDNPTIVEEYLSISIDELKERAWRYEEFLKKNTGLPIIEDIRTRFMVCIWKLVAPNPFDGMLNDEYKVTEDLSKIYEAILADNSHPVTHAAVEGITAFIESKDGVLGSYENMDEAYEIASKLHNEAMEKVEELYMKN